jgi:lysophospholipase L1-like esterase
MGGRVYMPDPTGVLPFRLKPNSEGKLFNSKVSINSLGFRGREVTREKQNAYRIVVLGESTTFGDTMNEKDQPWPEVLERIIVEKLRPSRRVEVINAGVPSYTLTQNLSRFPTEILPLKPDMLITYHGYNGFGLLRSGVAPRHNQPPPSYMERPVKLFAGIEYNLRLTRFKRNLADTSGLIDASIPLVETPYGKAYEQMIEAAKTNGIRLAIGNFSMAVTTNSPRDVIEFYRSAFPSIYWQMQANIAHSELVHQLAAKYPDVIPIDMHTGLDGEHEKFLDLVHLTQDGREQAAENVFAAIKKVLEVDLGERRPEPPKISKSSAAKQPS